MAASSTTPESVDVGAAREAVGQAGGRLPYPKDVLECVTAEASEDGALLDALRKTDVKANLSRVQAAAAACVVRVRSAPRFAEDLQRAAGGGLSDEQVACATREFGKLTPGEIEAASGAVLNPEQAEASATVPVERIYETCRIERGER